MSNNEEIRRVCCKPQDNVKEQHFCSCCCDCSEKNNPSDSKSSCC
jgi:hypothetical protein